MNLTRKQCICDHAFAWHRYDCPLFNPADYGVKVPVPSQNERRYTITDARRRAQFPALSYREENAIALGYCPKCGWKDGNHTIYCAYATKREECARLCAVIASATPVIQAMRKIAAMPRKIEHHGCLPEAAWEKRHEIWNCNNIFTIKKLVDEFAEILRAETGEIVDAALTLYDESRTTKGEVKDG